MYIPKEARQEILNGKRNIETQEELAFIIQALVIGYAKRKDDIGTMIHEVISALELCKIEFGRRVVPLVYNKKIEENGDVWSTGTGQEDGKGTEEESGVQASEEEPDTDVVASVPPEGNGAESEPVHN